MDAYRNVRLGETTYRGGSPAPATLDREIELLKRVLNYAVRCGGLKENPVARVALLRRPNTRSVVVDDQAFERIWSHLGERDGAPSVLTPVLQAIALVEFDTGMRKGEVLGLRRDQVDLREACVRLGAADTKTEVPRVVYLQVRTAEALRALPVLLRSRFMFVNPATGKPLKNLRGSWRSACEAAGLPGVWMHDLRRSFLTLARWRGVPESVCMRISGHRTRAVFERYNVVDGDDLKTAQRMMEQAREQSQESPPIPSSGRKP